MRRFELRFLLPSLWLAAWVLVTCLVVAHAGGSRWVVYGALWLLALAVLSTDLWHSRLQGSPLRPSAGALVLAAAVILAGWMIGSDDSRQVQAFMPVLCAVAATGNLRAQGRARCGWSRS